MTNRGMENDAAELVIGRIRDACLTLVKFDGVAVAAVAALVSIFKLEPEQTVKAAVTYMWVIQGLGGLLAASLALWGILVPLHINGEPKANLRGVHTAAFIFFVVVMAHGCAIATALGYISGILTCCEAVG